jgi:hypothetical protein
MEQDGLRAWRTNPRGEHTYNGKAFRHPAIAGSPTIVLSILESCNPVTPNAVEPAWLPRETERVYIRRLRRFTRIEGLLS